MTTMSVTHRPVCANSSEANPQPKIPLTEQFARQFRDLVPERFWAGQVSVTDSSVSLDRLKGAIEQVAKRLGVTFSGFLRESPEGIVYEISRYPRRAFGPVDPIETCQQNLENLVGELRKQGIQVQSAAFELPKKPVFRVVLGLEEGYFNHQGKILLEEVRAKKTTGCEQDEIRKVTALLDGAGASERADYVASKEGITRAEVIDILKSTDLAKRHSLSEIEKVIHGAVELVSAQIFVAGPWGRYEEAAAIITGAPENLDEAKWVAAMFHQARIAVEEIGPDGGSARMVEIVPYCADPDREPTYLGTLQTGEVVVDRPRSHIHDSARPLVSLALSRVPSGRQNLIVAEVDFGRVVGTSACVATRPGEEVVFAQRLNRDGLTRFVKNRVAEKSSCAVVVLRAADDFPATYVLQTAFIGRIAEPEPWDPNATPNSRSFWENHALVWGCEPVNDGTETSDCPW